MNNNQTRESSGCMYAPIFLIIIVAMLLLGACTPQSCPTYSDANYPPSKWDTVPATHADLIAYMHADTTHHPFTWVEKTGAAIAIFLVLKQADND